MAKEQQTCGKGLAANAALPDKLATLLAAMADLLDNHVRALPRGDANADLERRAYMRLVSDQRGAATVLNDLAGAMRSYRDLPPAPHDEGVLGDVASREVFAAFIAAEEDALDLLRRQTHEYRAMLLRMDA